MSKDGEVELYIETFWTHSRKLKDFFDEEFTNRTRGGERINYSVIKENWYVISGTNSKGYEFYKKFFVFSGQNGTWYICFDFVYPHSQRKIYDPVVAEIARKFVPNLPGRHGSPYTDAQSAGSAAVAAKPADDSAKAARSEDITIEASQWRIRPALVMLLEASGWTVTEPTVGSALVDTIAFTQNGELVQFKFAKVDRSTTIVHTYCPSNETNFCQGAVNLARVMASQ